MIRMRPGDVVFMKPTNWIGKAVTRIDGGPYSHVAIAVSSTHIAEAQGFRFSRIWPIYGKDVLVLDLGLTDEQREQVVHNAISVTGKWYDYRLILGYFIKHTLKFHVKALWNSKNSLICSELVATILLSVGYTGAVDFYHKNISPRELFELLTVQQGEE
ncbi:MAG: hypothetical protein LC650_02055 [Actinobacteria bacterium]|nr:hypothetical protein [Actinomycetota bacterium]